MKRILLCLLVILNLQMTSQNNTLPPGVEENWRIEYEKLTPEQKEEMSLDDYINLQTEIYLRDIAINNNPSLLYSSESNNLKIAPAGNTECTQGDFEQGAFNSWRAATGNILPGGAFTAFINGAVAGRHTIVGAGRDPNAPIQQVFKGNFAFRLGNNNTGAQAELISKTFIVQQNNPRIYFRYATVLQFCGGAKIPDQAGFQVRVIVNGNNVSNNTVSLGNGSDNLKSSDPFLTNNNGVWYRDWTLAQIDLSTYIGQQVTIELINNDCSATGHYGYTYIDEFCSDECQLTCFWNTLGNTGTNSRVNYLGTTDLQDLNFRTNNANRVTITKNGNVGIGIQTPGERLVVFNANPDNHIVSGGSSPSVKFVSNTDMARIGFASSPQHFLNTANPRDLIVQNFNDGNILFGTNSVNNERMRINANGNVGIGTTNPNTLLHLSANQNNWLQNIKGVATNIGDRVGLRFYGGYPSEGINNGEAAEHKWSGLTLVSESLYGNSNGLGFYTGSTASSPSEKVRISANGNVGIGTTNPPNRLSVSNTDMGNGGPEIHFSTTGRTENSSTTSPGTWFTVNGTRTSFIGVDNRSFAVPNQAFGVHIPIANIGWRAFNILNNGNVGIGTTAPQRRLEIQANTNASINNESGLRLTNLRAVAGISPIANPGSGVLSVDPNGDVIYVENRIQNANNGLMVDANKNVQLGRTCGSSTHAADLLDSREIPLNNFNVIFRDGNRNSNGMINRVGIGDFTDCNIEAKLHVNRVFNNTVQNNIFNRIGILSEVHDGSNPITENPTPAYGYNSAAFDGINDGVNDGMNIGTRLIVRNGALNTGAQIVVDNSNNLNIIDINNVGVDINVRGGQGTNGTNTGIRSIATADAGNVSSDFGIRAEVISPGVNDWAIYGNGRCGNSSGVFVTSDKKLKKDITSIDNAFELLNKIQPRKYDFDNESFPSINLPTYKDNYGVIAQELEEVLPGLIAEAIIPAKDGRPSESIKLVNYTELIPIAIAAIKELNTKVEKQNNAVIENDALKAEIVSLKADNELMKEKFALLEKTITTLCESGCAGLERKAEDVNILYQSIPNPTDDVALINYYLANEGSKAEIKLYMQEGKELQSFTLEPHKGNGSIKVSLGDLSNGTYLYTLIVDGKVIDTKQLQILK